MRRIIPLLVIVGLMSFSFHEQNPKTNQNKEIDLESGDTLNLIHNYLSKLSAEKGFSGGLLMIRDGRRIFSKGYGWADKERKIPFTAGTLASIGSITKAFTAAAIMKLVEQGKLTVDDPLKKFFPTIPVDKAAITIHHLLTHSSGFREFLTQDGGDYEKIEKTEFLKRAFAEPLAFNPGEKGVYTNVGFSILGIIIEQVSGVDYETYLRENLFEPAGIKKIGYHYPVSKDDTIAIGYQNGKSWGTHQQRFKQAGGGPFWNLKANGGLEASLDEMYLWINALSNHKILSEPVISKMFTSHVQEEGYDGTSSFGYGCNISQSRRYTKMIGNGGSNGIYFARMIRLPEEKVVFYMVTNESSINSNMVLPNVTQLYFDGRIEQDATTMHSGFESEVAKQIYEILERGSAIDLVVELEKGKIHVADDMILLEVGQKLIEEQKNDKARLLYEYYTRTFPNIVVAWNDLGDVYQALNRKEDAIKCYRQALKIRPENQRAKQSLAQLGK